MTPFILRWQAVPAGADPAKMLTGCRLIKLAQRRLDFERRPGSPA